MSRYIKDFEAATAHAFRKKQRAGSQMAARLKQAVQAAIQQSKMVRDLVPKFCIVTPYDSNEFRYSV
jgi:hypothetical protein